jgi:hypothetical protein
MIQIMQQERSFLRRVKCLRPFIYENCPSSRRAYFSIRLAVKTSRPHFLMFSSQLLVINLLTELVSNRPFGFAKIQ